jgi:alkanesulfonate monooxygenase SsuD/methylene tetrahydromethanopterin reductase-like flavin-dependent oxidoreductase (luciferase family)
MSDHDVAARAAFYSRNALKLGTFASNCSAGRILTTVPHRWSGAWNDNLALARFADACGLEFMVPIGRWKGYGGVTDHQGASLETITWATGLLAGTRRISVFGTVHTPLFHPLIAAKQMVTADHVGHGRFGLNIVAGWNEDEFRMFGADPRDHERRYLLAQEWIDVVRLAWERDDVDFDGEFFHLRGVREKPKPYGGSRPVIMNAGQSPTGRAFSLRNADLFFTSVHMKTELAPLADEIASVKASGRTFGREMEVFTSVFVMCRATRREAEDELRWVIDECADWGAIDTLLEGRRFMLRSEDDMKQARSNFPRAALGFALVGDPDDVTRGLADFARAGLRGLALTFVNYLDELPRVREEVLPRLERLGLRVPVENEAPWNR